MAHAMAEILKSQDVEIDSDVVNVVQSELSSKTDSLHGSLPKFARRFKSSSSKNLSCRDDLDEEDGELSISIDISQQNATRMDSYGPGTNGTAGTADVNVASMSQFNSNYSDNDINSSSDIDSRQDKINKAFSGVYHQGGGLDTGTTDQQSDYVSSPYSNVRPSSVPGPGPGPGGGLQKRMSHRGLNMQTSDIYTDEGSAATAAFNKVNKTSASPAKATAKKAGRRASKLFTGKSPDSEKKVSKSGKGSKKYNMAKMNSQQSEAPKVDGRAITQKHSQYALTYGMMMGIRVSAGRFMR